MNFGEELSAAQAKAQRLGLSFYIARGTVYIQDDGQRGLAGEDGCSYCWGESVRKASEEEVALWESIQ